MPEIEYVTLANHAEALNGLLYLQGAGWTDVVVEALPNGQLRPVHMGVGVSILVGWNETNVAYPMGFRMVHEDGGEPVLAGEGQVETGRPAGTAPGAELRNVLAIGADVVFPRPGGYRFEVSLAEVTKGVSFRVHLPPSATPRGTGPTAIDLPPMS